MKKILLSAVLTGLGSGAFAATVDFESVVSTSNFTSPPGYSEGGLTFTTVAGAVDPVVRIIASGDTRTDFVLACDGADFGMPGVNPCEDTTLAIDFGGAIESLSFNVVSDETTGSEVFLTFFTVAGSFMRSFSGLDADPFSKDLASFTGLGGALSVHLTSNDVANVGFDDFMVVYASTDGGGGSGGGGAVDVIPLPGGLPLLAGALGLGAALRRRRCGG